MIPKFLDQCSLRLICERIYQLPAETWIEGVLKLPGRCISHMLRHIKASKCLGCPCDHKANGGCTAHSLLWGTVTKSCVLLLTLLSSESLLCDVCQLIWIYDKQGFGISPPIWISEYSFFSAEIQQPPPDKREEQRKLRVNVMASVQMCSICDPKWKAERRGQSRGQTWLASNSLDQQAYHLCFSSPHSHLLIWPPMLIRKMEMEPSF